MSSRPAAAGNRPTLERRRRTPLQFLQEEWGLLCLAAVLTFMTWHVTRLDVEAPRTLPNMVLEFKMVSDSHEALVPENHKTVDIELYCSESEYEEAKAMMLEQGNKIIVQVDAQVSDSVALSPSNCTFRYPFRTSYLKNDQAKAIPGWLYRVQLHSVTIEKPAFENVGGATELPEIDFESEPLTLRASPSAVGDTIQPDPISLEDALADRKGRDRYPYRLTFERWVQSAPSEAARLFRRSHVKPQLDFTATLRFVKIDTRKIKNRAIYDVQNAEWYTFKVLSSRRDVGLNLDPPDYATLPLRAPESLLKALEDPENQQGWAWGIQLNGALPKEGEPAKPMRADVVFMPIEGRFRDPRIEFTAPKDAKGFEIEVERPKRGP